MLESSTLRSEVFMFRKKDLNLLSGIVMSPLNMDIDEIILNKENIMFFCI